VISVSLIPANIVTPAGPCSSLLLILHFHPSPRYGSTLNPFSTGGAAGSPPHARPILIDARKMAPTGINPPSLWAATAAKPIEAMHPHDLQSGVPPYWHGVISVRKSAETVLVVSANTQSLGLSGGSANWRINPSGISSFG